MGLDDEQTRKTGISKFQFSAVAASTLGASEYTIVSTIVDVSGSVVGFRNELEKCLGTVTETCRKSPRSENLLMRLVSFNTKVEEIHGFRELKNINPTDYDGILDCDGMTAMFDAVQNGLEATVDYGKDLFDMEYGVNGIAFVITDGLDNASKLSNPGKIASLLKQVRQDEKLESMIVVLIGVTEQGQNGQNVRDALEQIKTDAGFDQFIDIGEATPSKLAKLAAFISQSVSSQSQALGTGGPSNQISMEF